MLGVCGAPKLHSCSTPSSLGGLGGGEMDVIEIIKIQLFILPKNVREIATELVIVKFNEEIVPAMRLLEEV